LKPGVRKRNSSKVRLPIFDGKKEYTVIGIRLIYMTALILLFSLDALAAPHSGYARYLSGPTVKWEGNRLVGDLRNVPVRGLLEELLQTEGVKWEVEGDLNGQVSVSFDDLTLEESIRKVLKSNRYSYTLIQSLPDPPDPSSPSIINRLTVYQDDKMTRFWRTDQKLGPSPKNLSTPKTVYPANSPPVTVADGAPRHQVPPLPVMPEVAPEDLERVDKEIKEFLSDLLKERQISAQEYEKMMTEMGKGQE